MPRSLKQLAGLPVSILRGVGDKKAGSLADMGIESVLDLVTHYPRRYLDRTQQAEIGSLHVGEEAMVMATVKRISVRRTRNKRALVEADVFDGSSYLRVTFFNQAWRAKQLPAGTPAVFFGKLELYRGRRQMTNPVVDLVGNRTGRIFPIYPQSEKAGVDTWELADWIDEALGRAGDFADPLPEAWKDRLNLQERTWAFNHVHKPESLKAAAEARRRLAFDELLRLQVTLVMRKR
ncbi:MAG: ATP-dependent helicase RecG, partial [Actinomycetota bacterium]|nr:ATP-dependent helicase RecG [Actinomycetota bacterium]